MSDETTNGHRRLTRDEILGSKDFRIELVDVPEWGGSVFVRSLRACERDNFEGSRVRMKEDGKVEVLHNNVRARLAAAAICHEDGTLIFSLEDVEMLGAKDAAALDRVYDVATRLSRMRPEDIEAKVKNSVAVRNVNSSSDLRSH